MTTVCCFDRVVSILIIYTDRGSCLSRNVSLIIQIWRRFLILNGGMYQVFVHIDNLNGVYIIQTVISEPVVITALLSFQPLFTVTLP